MEGTDKQADGGIDVEASLEMAGFRTPGQRLPQSFPPGFNKPLPEVLEEFGVAAFLGEDGAEDGHIVPPDHVGPQVLQDRPGVGSRLPRRAG